MEFYSVGVFEVGKKKKKKTPRVHNSACGETPSPPGLQRKTKKAPCAMKNKKVSAEQQRRGSEEETGQEREKNE